jgi:hypothetical protein
LAGVHQQLQELSYTYQPYEVKKKEFLALKQGAMSVIEYREKFVELSHYVPEEVVDEEKNQELFMEGLAESLQYQLIPHTFPSFQTLLDKAIGLEYKRKELEELKRKATTPGQSGSNTRPHFNSPQETPFQSGDPSEDFGNSSFSVQCSRLPGPVLYRIVRWRQLSLQGRLSPLEALPALSVERLGIMQVPAPREMFPTL